MVRDRKERRARGHVGGCGEPEVADAEGGGARDRRHRFAGGRHPAGRGAALRRSHPRRETDVPRRADELGGPRGELGIIVVGREHGTDAQQHVLGDDGAVERVQRWQRIGARAASCPLQEGLGRDTEGLDLIPGVGDGALRALEKGERGLRPLRVGRATQGRTRGDGADPKPRPRPRPRVARRSAPSVTGERGQRSRPQHREHVPPRQVTHLANECSGPG